MEGGHLRLVEKKNSTFAHVEFKGNEWSKLHIQCHLQTSPKKKQAIFTVLGHVVEAQRLPESCQLHLRNWRSIFLVATAVALSIAFLPPIGDACKSHVNVDGHSDKMYHQLMATQVKFPRKSLATEAAHGFMQDLH
jgi:hypothetical protein